MSPEDVGPAPEGCAATRERLDDYAAGALAGPERARVESHLASCADCRAEADAWRALLAEARSLPRSIAPPRDLWPGIDARIDAVLEPARGRGARPGLPRWALAAAAIALVVVTAAVSSLLTRRWDEAMALKTGRGGESEVARPDAARRDARVGEQTDEARYLAASGELLAGLEERDLAPETMALVRRNLAVIDAAIAELHEALEKDPGNGELTRMLLATYQQKIDLLEQAARAGET